MGRSSYQRGQKRRCHRHPVIDESRSMEIAVIEVSLVEFIEHKQPRDARPY